MMKYFLLQLKRLLQIWPYVLFCTGALLVCLLLTFKTVGASLSEDDYTRFRLAFVASEEDGYFNTGFKIVQSDDSSRFAIDTLRMTEPEAIKALERDKIDAYVIVPDGYIQQAMSGYISPLKYVSTTGAADLSTLFKDEITTVVSEIIIACEKAMYGADELAQKYGRTDQSGKYTYDISMTYVDYILDRQSMYIIEEYGVADALGFDGYLFSGIFVFLLTLIIIPFSVCFIKEQFTFEKLIKSRGIGPFSQIIAEFSSLLIYVSALIVLLCLGVTAFFNYIPEQLQHLTEMFLMENTGNILAVVFCICAFVFFLFQLSDQLISGTLLQFFLGLAMCFAAGCLYPVYFFPDRLQAFSGILPQSHARIVLSGCITGSLSRSSVIMVLIYGVVFVCLSVFVRVMRLRKQQV